MPSNLGPWSGAGEERERNGQLRPGRVRRSQPSPVRFTVVARNLLRLARIVSRSAPGKSRGTNGAFPAFKPSAFERRCVVNVRYSSSRTPGGWRAHGCYLERESAKSDREAQGEEKLGLAKERSLGSVAGEWQKAGDKRLFKVVISPEDQGADFVQTAEALNARIEHHSNS